MKYAKIQIIMDHLELAKDVVKKLVDAGHTAYFAGGWVRDYLMQHPSADIDIATDATPEQILKLFDKTIEVGIAFGVVIVIYEGHQFEISTFRRDIESHGRRPEKIEHSTPEEDAQRRDFTINGIFFDPLKEVIYDFVGGQKDIEKGVIRTIGIPQERFYEDRLRMIRAVRFASRFNFKIDPATEKAIRVNATTLFPHVAMERVFQELTKMADHAGFDQALIQLHQLGLLPVIFESLQEESDEEIKGRVSALPYFPDKCPAILKIMELFPNAALNERLQICHYLKAGNYNARLVEFVTKSKELIERSKSEKIPLTIWTHFYANPDAKLCLDVVAAHLNGDAHTEFLKEHSDRMEKLHPHSKRISEKKPLITGKLLQEEGVDTGKTMGVLLKEAEYLAITHDLHEAIPVLELLKKSPNWP